MSQIINRSKLAYVYEALSPCVGFVKKLMRKTLFFSFSASLNSRQQISHETTNLINRRNENIKYIFAE